MAEANFAAHGDPLNFIDDIYGCAIDPRGWPAVLRECARRVGGCAATILRASGENAPLPQAHWSINRKFEKAMRTVAARMACLFSRRPLRIENPFAVRCDLSESNLPGLHLGGEIILPKHISDIAVIPLTDDAEAVSVLIVLRSDEAGAYRPDEIGAIAAMSPHFQRAAEISSILDFKPLGEQRSVGSFNRMPMAFILTDGVGRIIHANAAAADMLDGCPLLCLEDELAARDGRSDAALRSAITSAATLRSGARSASRKVESLIVTGPGSRAIEVWVIPVAEPSGSSALLAGSARVAVFARAIDAVAEKKTAADEANSLAAALVGNRPDGAAVPEHHLIARLAEALQNPARAASRPLSALSEMSVVRRAERFGRLAASARTSSPEL